VVFDYRRRGGLVGWSDHEGEGFRHPREHRRLGLGGGGLVGSLVTALIGAIILLFIVGLFKKA